MDENYLLAAAQYVEMNPIRAKLAADPFLWDWSSARAHLDGRDDELVTVSALLEMVGDWGLFLGHPNQGDAEKIRSHERTGRALGNEAFLDSLEAKLMRAVKLRKPGRKRKPKDEK